MIVKAMLIVVLFLASITLAVAQSYVNGGVAGPRTVRLSSGFWKVEQSGAMTRRSTLVIRL